MTTMILTKTEGWLHIYNKSFCVAKTLVSIAGTAAKKNYSWTFMDINFQSHSTHFASREKCDRSQTMFYCSKRMTLAPFHSILWRDGEMVKHYALRVLRKGDIWALTGPLLLPAKVRGLLIPMLISLNTALLLAGVETDVSWKLEVVSFANN